jgi:hypothetical protein
MRSMIILIDAEDVLNKFKYPFMIHILKENLEIE